MKKKNKNKTWKTIGVILLILIVLGAVYFIFKGNTEQTGVPDAQSEDLPFCSTIDSCISYLEAQGMPDGYLESEGIEIICENGKCQAVK